MKQYIKTVIFILCTFLISCSEEAITSYTEVESVADIYPQYDGTYIPYNIAPINFRIENDADKFRVRFVSRKDSFEISTSKNVKIPLKKWKDLLEGNRGDSLRVKIFAKQNSLWQKYEDINFIIAEEAIDPYIAYRLIEPGYAAWNKMGLYQRCIEDFEESPIMLNTLTDKKGCMNCHSFWNNDPGYMLFHLRHGNPGTIMATNGEVKKVDIKASWMNNGAVYPRWHPSARYVAFSSNKTDQRFRVAHTNKIEVFDYESDIVIYDVEENKIFTSDLLNSRNSFETFPEWSPDGLFLYFCSAQATVMPEKFDSLKYDLVRVAFDPATRQFSNKADTVVSARETGKSVSMPRISPDGKHLLFCMSDYGTFPIWHRENDIYHLNLETGEMDNMSEMNSDQSDSYHSWSSNGRWIIFSSRRMDGTYTRPYISYFDLEGNAHKPILLPQERPDYYDYLLKSYNIPEFITGKIEISPNEFREVARSEAIIPES